MVRSVHFCADHRYATLLAPSIRDHVKLIVYEFKYFHETARGCSDVQVGKLMLRFYIIYSGFAAAVSIWVAQYATAVY